MVSVGYIKIKIGNATWSFNDVKRRKVLGTKKFLYVGNIQDPISGAIEINVIAKNTQELKSIVKTYISSRL